MKQVNCSVTGTRTDTPILKPDTGPIAATVVESPTRVIFEIADQAMGGATILYGGKEVRVILPLAGSEEGPVLTYASGLSRINAGDDALVDDDGQRVVLGLSTDFRLFQMYLDGDDIQGILAQRVAAGAQGVRVFGTCDFLFKLDPRTHGGGSYYWDITLFAQALAEQGLYLQFTAMADAQMLRDFDQQEHWRACCAALQDAPNAFCELANENQKNGVDARQFSKPAGAGLVSSGSFCDGWEPTGTWGDLVTFHPRRDWKWPFTVAATANELRAMPGYRKPIWIGEPIGAADQNEPGRRANDPALFEKMAVDIGLWTAGGVFHSQSGLTSQLWTETEEACARAFFRGLHR